MKYIIDNDLHIHTKISGCSNDPEQTTERILKYAVDNNLKYVSVADHFWDEKAEGCLGWYKSFGFDVINRSLPLPSADGVNFLFGCETELNMNLQLGLSKERYDEFDFIVIPTTHMFLQGITCNEPFGGADSKARANLWVKRFDAVLNMDLPFHKVGIAHLTCSGVADGAEAYKQLFNNISDKEMFDLFTQASKVGVGIELNYDDIRTGKREGELVWRPYRIAKECGCKFYFASDAHHPDVFDKCIAEFDYAIDVFNLTEDDKFRVGGKN